MGCFMQVDAATATGAVTSFMSNRSDPMVILLIFCALFGWWMWKVHMPRQESERAMRLADKEIQTANAATLNELAKVTTNLHTTAVGSNRTLNAMMLVKQIELDCLRIVSDKAQCDIREQLSEAKGVLNAVNHGATSE